MDKIETENLLIRPYRHEDGDFVVSVLSQLEVSRWLTKVAHPFTHSDLKLFHADGSTRWPNLAAVEDRNGQIGAVASGEVLGYWLAPAAQGKGYARQAAARMVQHTFETTTFDRIKSGYFLGNTASARILERLKFEVVDEDETICLALGQKRPMRLLELRRENWEHAA